jgi:hypothetical protein
MPDKIPDNYVTKPKAIVAIWFIMMRTGITSRSLAERLVAEIEGSREDWADALTPVYRTSGFEFLISEVARQKDVILK